MTKQPQASKQLWWKWLEVPATFCDYYTVDYWESSDMVRFAFGEYTGKDNPPFYRVGIAMTLSDVKQLVETLNRIIQRAEGVEAKEARETSEGG